MIRDGKVIHNRSHLLSDSLYSMLHEKLSKYSCYKVCSQIWIEECGVVLGTYSRRRKIEFVYFGDLGLRTGFFEVNK